jgi:hypothetical protein
MGSGHLGALLIAKQYRQTVGGHNCAGQAGLIGKAGISLSCRSSLGPIDHLCAMNLVQPQRRLRQTQSLGQGLAIGLHSGIYITHMQSQIIAIKRF